MSYNKKNTHYPRQLTPTAWNRRRGNELAIATTLMHWATSMGLREDRMRKRRTCTIIIVTQKPSKPSGRTLYGDCLRHLSQAFGTRFAACTKTRHETNVFKGKRNGIGILCGVRANHQLLLWDGSGELINKCKWAIQPPHYRSLLAIRAIGIVISRTSLGGPCLQWRHMWPITCCTLQCLQQQIPNPQHPRPPKVGLFNTAPRRLNRATL
jgi:hypothetical protein